MLFAELSIPHDTFAILTLSIVMQWSGIHYVA